MRDLFFFDFEILNNAMPCHRSLQKQRTTDDMHRFRWKTCPSNADKSSGRRMSLNRSQYGGCSTGLQHPDRYLGRLRTISRLHVYLVVYQKPASKRSYIAYPAQGSISVALYSSAVKRAYFCRTTRKRQGIVADLDGMLT